MFPIRDHNPSSNTPVVVWCLIAANVVIFAGYWSLFASETAVSRFFLTWGLVPRDARAETFLTSMFLHGSLLHLGGNMLFLWVFGDNMEDAFGHLGFTLFYFAGGLAAGIAQYVADPASPVPMIGASGAIAAVMGGYLLLYPKARVDILVILIIIFRIIPVPAWIVLGAWFCIQLYEGSVTPAAAGGVAHWAHLGGFLAGLLMTLPAWLSRGGPAFWRQTAGRPPFPEARYRTVRTSVPRVPRRRGPWDRS